MLYAFLRHKGLSWHISNNPDLDYIQHDSNEIGANSGIFALLKRIKMLKSGWYRNQVNLIQKVVTGQPENLLCLSYISKYNFRIRRKKTHAIFLSIAIIFRIV